ncbi:MAG: Fe-S cluster assembly protein SufB, partial [Pseudomonadota bacterium]
MAETETAVAVEDLVERDYSAGFVSDVEADTIPAGLDESVVRFISEKKGEPEWLTDWRLKAFALWQEMTPPAWAHVHFPEIDFQAISYYSAPRKPGTGPQSLEDVDPELLRTYEKLGIPLHEQEMLAGVERKTPVAVDAVFDSVSITTTFKEKLAEAGVIFCPISEAVHDHPELVQKYLGSVVPQR